MSNIPPCDHLLILVPYFESTIHKLEHLFFSDDFEIDCEMTNVTIGVEKDYELGTL